MAWPKALPWQGAPSVSVNSEHSVFGCRPSCYVGRVFLAHVRWVNAQCSDGSAEGQCVGPLDGECQSRKRFGYSGTSKPVPHRLRDGLWMGCEKKQVYCTQLGLGGEQMLFPLSSKCGDKAGRGLLRGQTNSQGITELSLISDICGTLFLGKDLPLCPSMWICMFLWI